jgi:hypothetical protein
MRYIPTIRDVPHSSAEICLNLWFFVDDSGIVLRLAGKAYALVGTEEEKLAALHLLSGTDHLTATPGTVPKHFVLQSEAGEIPGAVPVATLHENHSAIFSPLMDQLERELPKVIHSVNDNYQRFTQKLPQEPLCVTTAVYESADGQLFARIGQG